MDPIYIFGFLGILAFLIVNNKQTKLIMKSDELAAGLNGLADRVSEVDAAIVNLGQQIKTNPEIIPQNVADAYNNVVARFQKLGSDFVDLTTEIGNGNGSSEGSAPAEGTGDGATV